MSQYNIIAESSEYTVVSEFEHAVSTSDAYQSEAELEREFIRLLQEQGYEYLPIHKEAEDLKELIESESLRPVETARFIENSFRDGQVRTTGTRLAAMD